MAIIKVVSIINAWGLEYFLVSYQGTQAFNYNGLEALKTAN